MGRSTKSKNRSRMSQAFLDSLINKETDEAVHKPVLHNDIPFEVQPAEHIRDFVATMKDMISRYHEGRRKISSLEAEMQDILHFIEMGKDKDIQKGFKLYKRLQEIRKERRRCKNEVELLAPVFEAFNEKNLMSQLESLADECDRTKKFIDGRSYVMKTQILEDFFETE